MQKYFGSTLQEEGHIERLVECWLKEKGIDLAVLELREYWQKDLLAEIDNLKGSLMTLELGM